MSIVKGKEILNKSEVKKQIGYLSVNLSPRQWKLVKNNKLKVSDIVDNSDKVYQDKTGEQRLDMRLSISNETTNIKVLGNEQIEEVLELFAEIDTVYADVKYEQVYMRGRKLIDLELLDYNRDTNEDDDLFD